MFGNPSYPTYQAFLGLGIAAAIALLLMPWWIKLLKVEGIGQQVRADGPKRHLVKQGTPTMGGVVILVAISLTCLLMGKAHHRARACAARHAGDRCAGPDRRPDLRYAWALARSDASCQDDRPNHYLCHLYGACRQLVRRRPRDSFSRWVDDDLGVLSTTICGYSFPWLYIVFCWLMIAGLSNAVNLTDGLDGLAGGTSMIAMLAMAAMRFCTET